MVKSLASDDLLLLGTFLQSELAAVIVYPNNPNYSEIKNQFDKSGHAFLLYEQRLVVIDGDAVSQEWFTSDHLYVILAHELAHYRAKHAIHGPQVCDIEKEADWLGCMILRKHNRTSASGLHAEEYYARYSSSIENDHELMYDKLKVYIF